MPPAVNLIIDPLPSTVPVRGLEVPISTTFRTGMLFEMLTNSELSDEEKSLTALTLWYPDGLPDYNRETVAEACDQYIWFYSCGRTPASLPEGKGKPPAALPRRTYDFDEDAPLIYAAFRAQYGIDLQDVEDDLHWWKFCALFRGLTEEHEISKIMGYRAIDLSTIKNRQERERYAKLQARFALPDHRSTEEKAQAIGAIFGGMR